MSPTIVLKDGKPFLALGSPGGSTIITTVTQMLFNRIDREMTLEEAIAEPRASQRNTAAVTAEPEFIDRYGALLTPYGHSFQQSGDAVHQRRRDRRRDRDRVRRGGLLTAVAEPRAAVAAPPWWSSSSPAG